MGCQVCSATQTGLHPQAGTPLLCSGLDVGRRGVGWVLLVDLRLVGVWIGGTCFTSSGLPRSQVPFADPHPPTPRHPTTPPPHLPPPPPPPPLPYHQYGTCGRLCLFKGLGQDDIHFLRTHVLIACPWTLPTGVAATRMVAVYPLPVPAAAWYHHTPVRCTTTPTTCILGMDVYPRSRTGCAGHRYACGFDCCVVVAPLPLAHTPSPPLPPPHRPPTPHRTYRMRLHLPRANQARPCGLPSCRAGFRL